MKLQVITLAGLSKLMYEIALWQDQSKQLDIIVLSFAGTYQLGSLGSGDGRFMAGIANAVVSAWLPSGLILDLRELKYDFGDTILDAVNVGYDETHGWCIPTRIVVSELSHSGMSSLMNFVKREPSEWLFFTREEAIDRVLTLIRED